MSNSVDLMSAKYFEESSQHDIRRSDPRQNASGRSREECNESAESFMIWGFFAVAMCAIGIITRSTL